MQERRYKIFAMNNKEYIIDEADLKKLEENADEMLVKLKQVMVHPASIIVIEPFFIQKQNKVERLPGGGVRMIQDQYQEVKPITDLFANELLQLK